jgi:hypothetical protein
MAKRAKEKKGTHKKSAKKGAKKGGKKPPKKMRPLDHDEPIVVDNGPVSISNGLTEVTLKGGGKRAERQFTKFEKLIVEKTDQYGMSLPTEEFHLDEDGSVTFHLLDPSTNKRDKIRVNRFGFPKNNVRLESSFDLFEFEDPQKKKLKMKANAMARLTVIDADGTDGAITVTLADNQDSFLFSAVKATVKPVKL